MLGIPQAGGPGGRRDEAANGGEEFRLVEQEGVVAVVGLDLDKADTGRPPRSSACTTSRLSAVGNSQSLVKETTQKRVLVPAKASASRPPWSAARSK